MLIECKFSRWTPALCDCAMSDLKYQVKQAKTGPETGE